MLDFKSKNYRRAIENRKKCIELKTPFPAYEWEKIGDIYLKTGETDSAQKAYIAAVTINASQDGAKNKLKNIFLQHGNSETQFKAFLDNAVKNELKASAKAAPEVKLTDLDSKELSLTQQKRKIIVLVFWDTWSDACKKEIPKLNELKEAFKNNSSVLFWAVSMEQPVSINKFTRETPFHFHLFYSGTEAKRKFNVIGFPTHLVIDKEGKIRFTHIGFSENINSELRQEIQLLLDEPGPVS
jgi:peroxiredoxin